MRWDDVLASAMTAASSDATLLSVVDGNADRIRLSGERQYEVPSIEGTLLSDDASELWEPVDMQWDIFATSLADLVAAERALRDLFDRRGPVTIEGTYMWAEFLPGGGPLEGPGMNDENDVFAKGVRFRFTPVRERLTKGRS